MCSWFLYSRYRILYAKQMNRSQFLGQVNAHLLSLYLLLLESYYAGYKIFASGRGMDEFKFKFGYQCNSCSWNYPSNYSFDILSYCSEKIRFFNCLHELCKKYKFCFEFEYLGSRRLLQIQTSATIYHCNYWLSNRINRWNYRVLGRFIPT